MQTAADPAVRARGIRKSYTNLPGLRGMDFEVARGSILALLARFGLTEACARRASTYSGGMRRRLDIAMSLIGSPPIVFLDEPTTGLNPEGRIEVWHVVKELAKGGATVLRTTHCLGGCTPPTGCSWISRAAL